MSIEEQVGKVLRLLLDSSCGPFDAVIAGISGGVDSMVLCDVLDCLRSTKPFPLVICHVHHGLRGEEADRDAQMVKEFAEKRDLPVTIEYVEVPSSRQAGESVEMAARRLRYDAFQQVANAYGRCMIVTAHHANDQAETLLDRLLRGTGPSGLRGMRETRKLGRHILVRPLLTIYKDDLMNYANMRRIEYVEDSTNRDVRFKRNRIRQELLPYLRASFNPQIDRTLVQLGNIVAEEDQYLTNVARDHALALAYREMEGVSISLSGLQRIPFALQRRVIKLVLEGIDEHVAWHFADIEAILALVHSQRKSRTVLAHGWIASSAFDILHIGRLMSQSESKEFSWNPFIVDYPAVFSFRHFYWQVEARVMERPGAFPATHWEAFFAFDEEDRFIFRPFVQGDRIEPLGMKGSKLVSDLFVEGKVMREVRSMYPLLTTAANEVLWVPGLSRSRSLLVNQKSSLVLHVVLSK
ncbi:MAG: tRNA lysidine(34) synthetase TilS [Acidibacillus sp.]|uniref:tRNA(Ile)-lysidine synthase n=1 Tax=Sulfoacidibacillus ferrooxidans TaxID=2005001 RepID=A0A9X1V6L6_9BACL|nr:tRNA lysidine(34) synthetase TilS [Sulfoacidibacillus ferrooxidans]MCI0182596.1 tRNA(Ile)-lysidine synthase [Sulfoacidibacillus ferrooxidans]MCY0894132.1 tRNA lysidine(34) synthetase TilS [Acidibacillus sp.]